MKKIVRCDASNGIRMYIGCLKGIYRDHSGEMMGVKFEFAFVEAASRATRSVL